MRTGVGYPSYAADATWAATGTFNANYPALNAYTVKTPTKVARGSGASWVFTGTFPANRVIGLFALINHNLAASNTVRIQAYSNTSPNGTTTGQLYDTGALAVWPTGAAVPGYPSVRPFLVTSMAIRSFRITITNVAAQASLEVGGIEVAAWWEWDGVSSRDVGVDSRDVDVTLLGGAVSTSKNWSPRILNGQLDYMKVGVKTEAVQDFQRACDMDIPFVFSLDADTPASWPRTTFLARNQELPPLVGALYRHDRFNFRFVEHLR